jgi:hypothetical protein
MKAMPLQFKLLYFADRPAKDGTLGSLSVPVDFGSFD